MHNSTASPVTGNLLAALSHLMQQQLADAAEGDPDAAPLNVVFHNPGCSVGELAALVGLSPSAAYRALERLVERRLITLTPAGVGRRMAASCTVSGRRLVMHRLQQQQQVNAAVLGTLSQVQLQSLTEALTSVARALAGDERTADPACRRCDQTPCVAAGCPLMWEPAGGVVPGRR